MNPRTLIVSTVAMLAGVAVVMAASQRSGAGERHADATRSPSTTVDGARAAAGPLPTATGDAVLRIDGVTRGNAGATLTRLDFATLDRIARRRVTLREPFLKRDVTFTVVPMSELLPRAGVASSARRLYLHALDDYHVDLPIDAVMADGLLATRANGKPLAIADGGPIRLVFANGSKLGAITDNWIWSVDSMRAHR